MTKTLHQQVRLWPSVGGESTDKIFGNGAPLHSHIARDLYRNVNNLQTYAGDQCFQFAFDAGYPASHKTSWTRQAEFGSSGEVFLGQLPLVIPHDALYLRWTLGMTRFPVGENSIAMDISDVHFFIAAAPCTTLDEDLMLDRSRFEFLSERVISVSQTSGVGGSAGSYKLVDDSTPGWPNPLADIPGIQEFTEAPVFWGVFTADVSNASVASEHVDLEDFSFWAGYQ